MRKLLDKNGVEITKGSIILYAGHSYRVADATGRMVGIYDEDETDHIDYLRPDRVEVVRMDSKDLRIQELESVLETVLDAVCSQSSSREAVNEYYCADNWDPDYKVDAFLTVKDIRKLFKAVAGKESV